MGKKKFIDKKKAVTFRLVNRSQQDPLYVDESAPQHVLVPIQQSSKPSTSKSDDGARADPQKRKLEQAKFGVFYDDDYDYLQHLREPGGKNEVYWEEVIPQTKSQEKEPTIQLPSSVFASEFEEEEGLMSKAQIRPGPRPDWDPDVVAALDEDFDFDDPDNQLDDDFVLKAMDGNAEEDDFDEEDDEEYSDVDSNNMGMSDEEDEKRDQLGPLAEHDFEEEEMKSRFTEYSMSSSVIRRNQQLSLLDDRFEKFYENYDEPEIGALDCEEIEGHVDINAGVLLKYAEEYHEQNNEKYEGFNNELDKERILKCQEESDEEMIELEVEDEKTKKWDCESILSTYSNCYNHPKMISEPSKRQSKIVINPKTGMPMNILDGDNGKLTLKSLAKLENGLSQKPTGPKSLCDGSVISTLSVLSIRPKDETLEEKRERKNLLKEYRTERRIERKANTMAFKEEKIRQEKNKINNLHNGKKIL